MNFIIISPLFWPLKNPEAYCSTRFASALAQAGHSVHVVTFERPVAMYENSYDALVHPAIKITHVPGPTEPLCFPYINWRWLSVWEQDAECIPALIKAVNSVFDQCDSPIIVSRSYPWSALTVAWKCRRQASKWIAHFSDPMIDQDPNTKLGRLSHFFKKLWMRRAMRHADAISVTCKRVRWYYREQLGPCADRAKFILATHIGDFKLGGAKGLGVGGVEGLGVMGQELGGRRVVFHDGDVYYGRGLQILEAVRNLNEQGIAVDFIQGRRVKNEGERKKILSTPHCFILDENASEELRVRARTAQVSFVADFNTEGLAYSPFLMSKFVYQIYEDKPMVVLSKLESEKHDYCVRYPEAGLFFADMKEAGSLERAIKAALEADPKTFDRTRIRAAFSEEKIAADFIEQLNCADKAELDRKWMER